ncbi:MAG: helix-hairpin-helix domain-containing protein [Prevotella sp.]|nr:helix-hairpin-helix domain-containing protein [Prevotella sp.]
MIRLLLMILTLWPLLAAAQTDWQEALRQWMTAEDVEEGYGEETMEMLAEQAETKLNLNQATRQQLEQLPFLSAQQVEGIMEYLYRYGPMRSVGELQMITALDYDTRRLLLWFVDVGQPPSSRVWPSMADVCKYGKHTLTATGKIPLYDRRGDRNGYLGYKYRHDVRYQFTYNDRLKAGITGAQDAGEPFFSNRNKTGYDHYSWYVQLRNMGRLQALNIGTFRVQMGLGLVMNSSFALGKLATLQSLGRSSHTLSAHTSRSQADYLQGAGATVRVGQSWTATVFGSLRRIDATLNGDSTARTLLADGYHRTPTEMGKKGNTGETVAGMSIGWRRGTLHISGNAVYTHLSRRLAPQTTTLYRRYAAQGSDFVNMSADYGYSNSRWAVSGETAIDRDGALATIHALSCRPAESLTLMAIHRYYDKRYNALHAKSFSEGGHVQNEHGVYAGATWRPSRSWTLQGYADYAHFGWARYLVSMPSDALDMLLSARWQRALWSWEGRYRMHIRQRDNSEKTMLQNRPEHRLRLRVGCQALRPLSLQSQVDAVSASDGQAYSRGVMLSQQASWQTGALRIDGNIGWFRTDDYTSRVYQYERSVQHDFSFPMFYGHGMRYSLMAHAKVGRHLTATAKGAVTNYFDRSTISSGMQQVDHSSMADLLLQIRWVF